ncbi:MAG: hypothetical protein ACLP01_11115 [Solirubrobacteraceae bacterium]
MEQTAESKRQIAFYLTGAPNGHLEPVDFAIRPALMAGYCDLSHLRYDFPVVLVEGAGDATFVCSLTSAIDALLQEIAPRGIEGERVRRHILRTEREIRMLLAEGAHGTLTGLWERAAPDLADARARLKVDGEVADCDQQLPRRLVEHAWHCVQRQKASRFHAEVDRLVQALSDILRAAFIHSVAGSMPESLQSAFGPPHHDQFDFTTMSRLLSASAPRSELAADRRERIEWALEALRRQRFFEPSPGTKLNHGAEAPLQYRFTNCTDAVDSFRARLPELVEFVKAMSIAELEADGRYVPAEHEVLFEQFDEDSLASEDLALFPDYLVCVGADQSAAVLELLASDAPVKVLVETEELLDPGHFGFGLRSTQLASTTVGLIDAFVLQTTSSNLYQLRDRLLACLQFAGPALISVFTGSATPSSDLPLYLTSAAALEGRAFPAFTYDPAAGPDVASRFSIDTNPQPEREWPLAQLEYADPSLRRIVEQVAFTLVDFAVCDRRYARHFARVPREHWTADTIPVNQWLSLDPAEADAHVPHVLAVDENNSLHRLIVDAKLMHAARRCRVMWHELRELGRARPSGGTPAVVEQLPAAGESTAERPEELPVEGRAPDEPWIETARCSTCNECTAINDRMFAYNENKQAYIKDPDAGSFRELVEAAAACQVAVIHPGGPRDATELGLDELVERAKAFQ